MKLLVAIAALTASMLAAPLASACQTDCYDSGNTGYHCVSDC